MSSNDYNTGEEKERTHVEMSFLEHLEELRWRLIKIAIGLAIATVISFIFIDFFVEYILLLPARTANFKLQNLRPFGQIFLYFQVAIIVGFIISMPNVFYQLWQFIAPALKDNEKRYASLVVIFSTFCFAAGVIFAYFIMLPLTLKFAAGFGAEAVENNFALDEYFSIVMSVLLGAGLIFELPMLSFLLSKLGILTDTFMRKYRRHAIVSIIILAAFLSPGTDPVSQVLLSIPLVILYEISIFIAKISQKKN